MVFSLLLYNLLTMHGHRNLKLKNDILYLHLLVLHGSLKLYLYIEDIIFLYGDQVG